MVTLSFPYFNAQELECSKLKIAKIEFDREVKKGTCEHIPVQLHSCIRVICYLADDTPNDAVFRQFVGGLDPNRARATPLLSGHRA